MGLLLFAEQVAVFAGAAGAAEGVLAAVEQEHVAHQVGSRHLVEVPGEGIELLHPFEETFPQVVVEQCRAAPSAVAMEPETVPATQLEKRRQRIVGAAYRGAEGGADEKRASTALDALLDELLQGPGIHAPPLVHGHLDQLIGADAKDVRRLVQRVVGVGRDEGEEGRLLPQAPVFGVGQHFVARREHGDHVAVARPRGHLSFTLLETHQFEHGVEHVVFHEGGDGGALVGAGRGVAHGRDHLGQYGGQISARPHAVEKTGVGGLHRVLQVLLEPAQDPLPVTPGRPFQLQEPGELFRLQVVEEGSLLFLGAVFRHQRQQPLE